MSRDLTGKYYVRRKTTDTWEDVAVKFWGLRIISADGLLEIGDAKNVYTEQWLDSDVEDFMVTTKDNNQNDVIVRSNVDVEITFIVSPRYADVSIGTHQEGDTIDTKTVHNNFIDYMCKHGDLYFKSTYTDSIAHLICLKAYKPTTVKVQRGNSGYILGTLSMHTIENVTDVPAPQQQEAVAQN